MINWGSLYISKPFKWCFSDHMLEKVPLNQLQEWSDQTSRKENKGRLLQTNCYLCCYRRHCSQFLVCQIVCNFEKPKIIQIFLKRLDTYQFKQNTSTITRLYHCKNTSKVVAKQTSSVKLIGDGYGTFLQAWNTLGELC